MKESLKQSLSQKMQQRLSPLQMKFVRMLEMNTPEVENEVRQELEENPALEAVDVAPETSPEEDFNETSEDLLKADYREDDMPAHGFERNAAQGPDRAWEPQVAAAGDTLIEYLTAQVSQLSVEPAVAAVATYIIGTLDDNGYMTRTLHEITDDMAYDTGIDIPREVLDKAFETVRSLDPAGVGAVDLRDCLLLQLDRLTPSVECKTAREIVAHYFDLFSLKHYSRLESALGISTENLRHAVDLIRSLNPKPGTAVAGDTDDRTRHIIPDFIVETDGENISVSMPNSIPELTIEQTFTPEAEQKLTDRDAIAFISRRREEASDFIDILRLRAETLFNVMTAIVTIQRTFFLTDDESTLRPMVLKDIAAITGYDLSVISRATSGKYVATASGTYPLKYFFNEGVSDDDSSTHTYLAAIREIIDGEDPASPLSDDAITAALADRGLGIARRTVAKYRERLGIPVARLRKKL